MLRRAHPREELPAGVFFIDVLDIEIVGVETRLQRGTAKVHALCGHRRGHEQCRKRRHDGSSFDWTFHRFSFLWLLLLQARLPESVSSMLASSSACSSSLARISSSMRRVVGSPSPM